MRQIAITVTLALAVGCGRTDTLPASEDGGWDLAFDTGVDTGRGTLDTDGVRADTGADAGRDTDPDDSSLPDGGPDAASDVDTGPSCPDPDAPYVDYISQDPRACSDIDFACADGWSGFDAGECGCGCRLLDDQCDATRFIGTSGMAEAFDLGARCEFLVACSTRELPSGRLPPLREWFPDARCGNGTTWGCPDGTASFCEAYVDVLDPSEVIAGCALSLVPDIDALLCGGDL